MRGTRTAPEAWALPQQLAYVGGVSAVGGAVALPSRYLHHAFVILLAGLIAATGLSARPWIRQTAVPAVAQAVPYLPPPPAAQMEALVKPSAVVTKQVNRPKEGVRFYSVEAGDTLSAISRKFDISVATIQWANGIESADGVLPLGRVLMMLPVSGILYTVQPEDKIEEVAWRFQSDVAAIIDFNQLTTPGSLLPGDTLIIPGGRPAEPEPTVAKETPPGSYRVVPGDAFSTIAARFGVTVEALAAANRLSNINQLTVGQELVIPSGDTPIVSVPAPAPPKPRGPVQYIVGPGDTLGRIAQSYGVSVETVMWVNQITNPNLIVPGTTLTVPPGNGVMHKVQKGESLAEIGQRYSVSIGQIVEANGLANANLLQIGTELFIPGGTPPKPVVAPQPQAAPQPAIVAQPAAPAASPADAAPAQSAPASPPAAAGLGAKIAGIAAQYKGYPYVWGGTSPNVGFDCSGFVQYVLRQAGISLPRDLWGQLQSGRRVAPEDIQPGDIVFFQNTYMPGLSHNGIAIGNGLMINAVDERSGVTISSIWDSYWAPRFYGARRPS